MLIDNYYQIKNIIYFYKNLLTFWHNTVILKLFQGEKGRNDLRITHEADYAIRVTYCLALAGEKQCAKDISEVTGVTLRFALKILRKLTQSGITKSYKGVAGGYELNHSPSEISLGAIIECIDGPIGYQSLPCQNEVPVHTHAPRMNVIFIACSRRSTGLCAISFVR